MSPSKKKPYVLIIPTYNSASTVVETLQAVLALGEELRLLDRVIVSDDGSKDNTLELVRTHWKSDFPLQVLVAPKNRGEYLNVNSAVMQLESDIQWYLMMHSDNLPKPGWVKALVDAAEVAPRKVGSVCTSYDTLTLSNRTLPGENHGRIETFEGIPESVYGAVRHGCWWHNSTAIVRVSAFKSVGGMPAKQGLSQMGDWDFSLRLMSNGWAITYIPRSLVVYRENAQSVSSINFMTHKDVLDRAAVTERYCPGCPSSILRTVYLDMTKTLLRRVGTSVLKRQWKRGKCAVQAIPKVASSFLYCARNRQKPFEPRAHAVLHDEKPVPELSWQKKEMTA